MLGAIIGDIVGSRFEWHNHKSKDFDFFSRKCFFTDDTIMTVAVAAAILDANGSYDNLGELAVSAMQEIGRPYPDCGYGGRFFGWMYSDNPQPYNSFGNGAAMRVSPCGFAARDLDEARLLSRKVTEVTHNHPEGLKGAEATATAIFLARQGESLSDIRAHIDAHYYPMDFTLDGIRDSYVFDETCQGTVPQALMAVFESNGFEDAIRNAISIGGDSDTLAAIAGGLAEAHYGVPTSLARQTMLYLDQNLIEICMEFEGKFQ